MSDCPRIRSRQSERNLKAPGQCWTEVLLSRSGRSAKGARRRRMADRISDSLARIRRLGDVFSSLNNLTSRSAIDTSRGLPTWLALSAADKKAIRPPATSSSAASRFSGSTSILPVQMRSSMMSLEIRGTHVRSVVMGAIKFFHCAPVVATRLLLYGWMVSRACSRPRRASRATRSDGPPLAEGNRASRITFMRAPGFAAAVSGVG